MNSVSLDYTSRLEAKYGLPEPDVYSTDSNTPSRPDGGFVISRNLDGSVLSVYGDTEYWDLAPYKTSVSQGSKLYWNKIPRASIDEAKWLIFIMIYMVESGRTGVLTLGTLENYHKVVKKLSIYSSKNNMSTISILESAHYVAKFIKENINHSSLFKYFISFLVHLLNLGPTRTGIKTLGTREIEKLREFQHELKETKQHAIIPPRIFSEYLTQLWSLINSFLCFKDDLIIFVQRCTIDKKYGRGGKNSSLSFEHVVRENGLTCLFEKYGVTGTQSLHSYLLAAQDAGKQLLHAYSGMRHNEILSLMFDCLAIEKGNHGRVVRLIGKTSKLVGQRKTVAWVTSKESEKIIEVLQAIAQLVATVSNIDTSQLILFPSPSYLGFVGRRPQAKLLSPHCFTRTSLSKFINSKPLEINSDDLTFLENVDDSRSWREEKQFQEGRIWKFTSHQYRRTLAYYCRQSGLVKLTSLKRQLKHITREMSLYYASGNELSNLFSDNDHFVKLYDNNKEEADSLAYICDIIFSDEALYGGHGRHVERFNKLNEDTKDNHISNHKRREIIDKFKKGALAYKETALGACMTTEPCDQKLLGIISACLSCPKAVVKKSKLKNVINQQQAFLKSLNITSIEYRTEKFELETLIEYHQKIDEGV